MKRLFNLRVLVWTLASLITLYVLFVALENWTGARALAAAKQRVAKEGENLDFMALVPPLPPEAENFCALEPLAGLTNPKNKPAPALEALGKLISQAPVGLNSIELGIASDVKPWIEHLAKNGIGKADATPDEMLAALDAAHPVLKTLADAAPQRRAAQFTPRMGETLGDGAIFVELAMPHYAFAQRLSKILLLRCHLATAAGQARQALHCLQASLRLCEACLREPVLIGQLVGVAIHATAMNRLWALLQARVLTEAELAILKQELVRLDFPSAMLQAMRGELAGGTQTLEAIRRRPDVLSTLFSIVRDDGRTQSFLPSNTLAKLIPLGFIDHSEAVIIEQQLDGFILPMKRGGYPQLKRGLKDFETQFVGQSKLPRPHHLLSSLMLPAYSGIIRSITESETRRRQALAALAIESFRLAKGSLPSSLPDGTLDVIDEKPMRYRVEGSGYVLWSIAHDEEDDGGKTSGKDERTTDAKFTGDWVWQMPAGS